MVLRSDEQANESEIERDKRFRKNVGNALTSAASIGTGAVSGSIAARVMPFLNQYIPPALAMKGISKVSPKLGSFLQKGQEMGLDMQEGLNFIKKNLGENKPQESSKKSPEQKNIIKQYSDELSQFLEQHIKSGRQPLEAGALAQLDPKYKKIISKLEQDHKTPFSSILASIYGGGEQAESQKQVQQPQQQQSPQQGQQPGRGSQARDQLLQAMQALSQNLKG